MKSWSNRYGNSEIETLLEEGESLLMQDIDKDLEMLEDDPFTLCVDSEKYEKARDIFKQILSIEPDNERANAGLVACDDMLDVYIPVQYIVPPVAPDIIATMPETEDVAVTKSGDMDNDAPRPSLKPWEVRRRKLDELRARDRAGMAFTARVFSEESEKADRDVSEIIETAKEQAQNGTDPQEVYDEMSGKLKELQERLGRIWKGHGPEVLKPGQAELRMVLGLKNT